MSAEDIGSLIHKVALALDQNSDQVLQERLGIGLSQFRILLSLLKEDGRKQSEIAGKLSQTEASVSRQVKLLDEKGLIVVRRNVSNRRDRLIFLTSKGLGLAKKSVNILNDYHLPMFDALNQKQQSDLLNTLQIIQEYLER